MIIRQLSACEKKYRAIVADPPYEFKNVKTGGSMSSGAAQKYPVMNYIQISCLPIKEILDTSAICFLWCPVVMVDEALYILEGWGFDYKTMLVWFKPKIGMGAWFRNQVELCLLGVRGKVSAFNCQYSNVITEKPTLHSRKPEAFWELVDVYCPEPRIELFARGKVRPRWDGWGQEAVE